MTNQAIEEIFPTYFWPPCWLYITNTPIRLCICIFCILYFCFSMNEFSLSARPHSDQLSRSVFVPTFGPRRTFGPLLRIIGCTLLNGHNCQFPVGSSQYCEFAQVYNLINLMGINWQFQFGSFLSGFSATYNFISAHLLSRSPGAPGLSKSHGWNR